MQQVQLTMAGASVNLDNTNPRVYLGRDATACALSAEDGTLSRRHAEVFLQGEEVYLRDLGSSNGTWVDGQPIQAMPVKLAPGQQIYVGHVPLLVEWKGGTGSGATVMMDIPPHLKEQMEARFNQAQAASSGQFQYGGVQGQQPAYSPPGHTSQGQPAPPAAPAGGVLGVGGSEAPLPADYSYRRQGSNSNGSLLIALKGDTFANDQILDGYLEFTALDNETVASVVIELVECHQKGPKKGHVWDRMLVRQGPWKAKKGDVLPMPFQLRVPPGTSVTGRDCHWELRGYVDINWAFDIEASSPINMRNKDIERIRDALGALDYRIANLDPQPLGQRFTGIFNPPAELRKQLGISNINLAVEYLGANLKVLMEVEKTSLFKFDKRVEFVFDLNRLRTAEKAELAQHFKTNIDQMMGR